MNEYSDPAMVGSNFSRNELDFYPTPEWVTKAFLENVMFKYMTNDITTFWEPACGLGHISEVIKNSFPEKTVVSTDIVNRGYVDQTECIDFLEFDGTLAPLTITITNPPYGKLLDPFIEKGIKVMEQSKGMLALLMRNEVDSASSRDKFFGNNGYFTEKHILLKRPRWVEYKPGDAAPRHNYAWYFWSYDKARSGTFPIITYGK